ncbi:hypothetical protein [Candidatus Binatus sp.]
MTGGPVAHPVSSISASAAAWRGFMTNAFSKKQANRKASVAPAQSRHERE